MTATDIYTLEFILGLTSLPIHIKGVAARRPLRLLKVDDLKLGDLWIP